MTKIQHKRDKSTIKRLKMVKSSRPTRNKRGKIVRQAPFQTLLPPGKQMHIQPNRKWFGNTKTITQTTLQKFRDDMSSALKDPYQIVMSQSKLPTTLLNQNKKNHNSILQITNFSECFGKKSIRKRPLVDCMNYEELASKASSSTSNFVKDKEEVEDSHINPTDLYGDIKSEDILLPSDTIFAKGQSKRIWNELYKVIDSADVLLQILDARDPNGTRSKHIENFLKQHKPHKHLVLVLNKCDLIPAWVSQKWVSYLSKQYPTLAYKASISQCFGKGSLIHLLRQFAKLHPERKQISVGFIGFPNVGKSSIINSLKSKKVCEVAPTPGKTKVWQYISLMNRIYLIDCPGVVYPEGDSESELILKGVVRVENVKDPENHIATLIGKLPRPIYLLNSYDLSQYYPEYNNQNDLSNDFDTTTKSLSENDLTKEDSKFKLDLEKELENSDAKEKLDSNLFLKNLALRQGKLLKGGVPDITTAAKAVLYDWQRGKIPFFTLPPVGSELQQKQ